MSTIHIVAWNSHDGLVGTEMRVLSDRRAAEACCDQKQREFVRDAYPEARAHRSDQAPAEESVASWKGVQESDPCGGYELMQIEVETVTGPSPVLALQKAMPEVSQIDGNVKASRARAAMGERSLETCQDSDG